MVDEGRGVREGMSWPSNSFQHKLTLPQWLLKALQHVMELRSRGKKKFKALGPTTAATRKAAGIPWSTHASP